MPNRNEESFLQAEKLLFENGFEVENPIHNPYPGFLEDVGDKWQYQMRKAVIQLMHCDGIMMLPGWQNSKGANIELWLAQMFGLDIYNQYIDLIDIDPEEISLPNWQAIQKHLGLV